MQKLWFPTIVSAAALLLSLTCSGSAQFRNHPPDDIDWRLCAGELRTPGDKPTLDERISACTRILDERGDKESPENRTSAQEFLGAWFEQKGEFDRAIAEYSAGPGYTMHYHLCKTYAAKRDFYRAIKECSESGHTELRGKLYFITGNYGPAASDLLFSASPEFDKLDQALWRYVVQKRAELVGDPLSVFAPPSAYEELDADGLALNKTASGSQFIDLFLGRTRWDETHRPVMNDSCDTFFFTGELHLLNGRELEAEQSLQRVIDSCGGQQKELEVFLAAGAELARIKQIRQYHADQILRDDRERRRRTAEFERLVEVQTAVIQNKALPAERRAAGYNLRGRAYLTNGELEKSIGDFSEAIALVHSQVEGFKNRCTAYAIKGDIAAATADCTVALGLDPNQTANRIARGELYFIAGDYVAAASEFAQARERNPNDPMALVWLDLANEGSEKPSSFANEKLIRDRSDCDAAAGDNVAAIFKCDTSLPDEWASYLLNGSRALDRAHFCEAQFYFAETFIRRPIVPRPQAEAKALALGALKKATATRCPTDTYEFLAAQAELRRLDKVLQEQRDQTQRQAQLTRERIERFRESLPKIRAEAGPIAFEYSSSAWGYAHDGCFINGSGTLYVYNSSEDPGIKVAGSINPDVFARAIEMAKAISNKKLNSNRVAFDGGISAWTASVDGTTTELKVAGSIVGELVDPKATELVKLINKWCPTAAAFFESEKRMKECKYTQPDTNYPIWICR